VLHVEGIGGFAARLIDTSLKRSGPRDATDSAASAAFPRFR